MGWRAEGTDGGDKSGLNDIVTPRPGTKAIATLTTPIMEAPRVDRGAAGAKQATIAKLTQRNTQAELESAAEVSRERGEPAAWGSAESHKPARVPLQDRDRARCQSDGRAVRT